MFKMQRVRKVVYKILLKAAQSVVASVCVFVVINQLGLKPEEIKLFLEIVQLIGLI